MTGFIFDVLGLTQLESNATGPIDEVMSLVLELRAQARLNKDFATSDKIRDGLSAAGVEIKDTREGVSWNIKN